MSSSQRITRWEASMNFRNLRSLSALFLFAISWVLVTGAIAATPPTYTEETTGMQFVSIPGGTYMMGDHSGNDPYASPVHPVTVKPFYLGKFEVTFAEYDQFARETKRELPDDNGWGRGIRPVINVNWHDAVAFTNWLSKKTGKKFRLPSEAEWEFAARGGTTTRYYWGDDFGRSNANCAECGSPWDGKQTVAVGSFKQNPFGLFDMIGNVYEWCLDTIHQNYVGAPTDGAAWIGKKDPQLRIDRGGSWMQPAKEMTVYRRCWDRADLSRKEVGFRVLMES